jgi:hypothetical protein
MTVRAAVSSSTSLPAGSTITTPNIVGVTDASSAAAGSVGEYIESKIQEAGALTPSSNTALTITSIALTAGDWNVWGIGALKGTGTAGNLFVSISTSTNTLGTDVATLVSIPSVVVSNGICAIGIPPLRVNIAAGATYYLVMQAGLGAVTTPLTFGYIAARRVR